MKFSIEGKVYDVADLDLVSLKDILLLEKQSAEMGRALTWGEVGAIGQELEALKTDQEREAHPGAPWILAVTVWASRRIAGEDISFEDAVSFKMRDLRFIAEPQDKPKANPTKARPGSGRAANRPSAPAEPALTSPETSGAASTSV